MPKLDDLKTRVEEKKKKPKKFGEIDKAEESIDLMAVDNPTTVESAATLVMTTEGLTVDRVILTTTSNSGGSTEASVLLSAWIVPLSGGGGVGTG